MLYSALPDFEHERVILRPIIASDIECWFRYLVLPEVYEHTSWDVHAATELDHYVWKPEEFTASAQLRFAVALRSNNELVGTAGFHTVSPQNHTAEMAYDLAPQYWGQGIASAVCKALVEWAQISGGIVRVQATVLETNRRSMAVLERSGFKREGLLQAYRKVRGRHGNFYMYAHVASGADA